MEDKNEIVIPVTKELIDVIVIEYEGYTRFKSKVSLKELLSVFEMVDRFKFNLDSVIESVKYFDEKLDDFRKLMEEEKTK